MQGHIRPCLRANTHRRAVRVWEEGLIWGSRGGHTLISDLISSNRLLILLSFDVFDFMNLFTNQWVTLWPFYPAHLTLALGFLVNYHRNLK